MSWFTPDSFEKKRADFYEKQMGLALEREKDARAELKAAYKTIERISLRSADAALEFAGKKGKFTPVEKRPEDVILLSPQEQAEIEHYARELREADMLAGRETPPIEEYIDSVKQNRDKLFV